MTQESIENVFAKYISEGKWDENNVPKKIKSNVDKKVKKIKEENRLKEDKIKGGDINV